MAKTISCREVGLFTDCDEVMRGETDEQVLQAAAAHGRQRHGMTDDQLQDPTTQQQIRGFIREG
jgi:predicted small metal-binding protein